MQKVPEVGIEPTRGCPHGILSHMPTRRIPQSNPITPKQFKHFSSCNMGLIGDVWGYVPHSFPHNYCRLNLIPTATSIFDMRATTQYVPPTYLVYPQEATYVTSLPDQWGRIYHSHL